MKYAAFFRGINVGGKNMVNMAQLKKLFSDIGFQNVRTYIQSGNVVFDAEEDAAQASEKIRRNFYDVFGFDCTVMLRTSQEIEKIIDSLPFSGQKISDAEAADTTVEHLYVYLMDGSDIREKFNELVSNYSGHDSISLGTNEVYLLCHESIRNSKPAVLLNKLNVPLTSRNWKTMCKIREIITE